jgi:peroxiredoxin
MRPAYITVPLGCLFACIGGLMWVQARARGEMPYSNSTDIISNQPRHLVTAQMTAETEARLNKLEPTTQTADVTGKPVTIASHNAPRPQFVYFVQDGCPCSFDAEPLFHDLSKQFKGEIDFVSVTNGDAEKAGRWNSDMAVPYPVVSDPKEEIIHRYGAKSSVYSVLISKDGHVAKMWPGYSHDLLLEMNSLMAKIAGVPERKFDTKYAPIIKATGCAFSDPNFK